MIDIGQIKPRQALNLKLYQGRGIPIAERAQQLPDYQALIDYDDPALYVASSDLTYAVNVALALGQPLLVTGEPGTGKTQLARSIAYELKLPLMEFYTKTTSTATDLFYRYDALQRFQDAHAPHPGDLNPENYIDYQALGLAILFTGPPQEIPDNAKKKAQFAEIQGATPTRAVVLVDEIDKAPRDLPNDVLNEFERMEFTVRETSRTFRAEESYRPIMILTSNSEKNLPDAFLRRCVYHHIPFPGPELLKEIIRGKFKSYAEFTPDFIEGAIEHFVEIRNLALKKKPATAELVSWVRVLETLELNPKDLKPGQAETLAMSYSILAKTQEDLALLKKKIIK
jgi:MoxR-like ATPase